MKRDVTTVLALSSEVGVGAVGLSIARFAFTVNNIPAICLPTVFFASRPDMGRVVRHEIPTAALAAQLDALADDGRLAGLGGVMTGYFASTEQVEVTAGRIRQLKAESPSLIVLVDPVLGDHETGIYVTEEVAAAVRDLLVPLATVITPNQFEFLWLAGVDVAAGGQAAHWPANAVELAARLPAKHVVVTSAEVDTPPGQGSPAERGDADGSAGEITTMLLAGDDAHRFTAPYFADMPKGTGDVFAAYMLGRLVHGDGMVKAAENSAAYLAMIAEKARGQQAIEPFLLF